MSAGLFALMSKKGREEKRLKELRDAFDAADKDKDGQLTPSEWLNVLKATGVEASKEDVEIMFAEKDRDNDGHLSFEEFTGQETKVEKAFKAMDRDGDGYVTKSEFQKVCKNLTKEQIQAAFNKFDKSGNGKLNYVEFCGMMNARKKNSAEQQSASSSGASTPTVSKS